MPDKNFDQDMPHAKITDLNRQSENGQGSIQWTFMTDYSVGDVLGKGFHLPERGFLYSQEDPVLPERFEHLAPVCQVLWCPEPHDLHQRFGSIFVVEGEIGNESALALVKDSHFAVKTPSVPHRTELFGKGFFDGRVKFLRCRKMAHQARSAR